MAKKKKKSWKKKLLKAALIGGALYGGSKLLKNRRATSIADMDDAAINVTHDALKPKFITKKTDVEPEVTKPDMSGVIGYGHPITQGNIKRKQEFENRRTIPGYGSAVAPPGILNPYNRFRNIKGRLGGNRLKGGGIAKRGTGAAYKSGGRVKSMGIAKRGAGAAKR